MTLRSLGRMLEHLLLLTVGVVLLLLDAWDDLKYQLAKAMR
jgi:hypothetical protein